MNEEIIIDLKLETDDGAFSDLARLKNAILNNQQEVAELKKAYKEELITQKEFASEVVRLEANAKKLNNTYNETQRKVTGLQSPYEKLSGAIKDQAEQVNVAGLSLKTFANPVTATVGVLGALFKAYEASTVGAKDLEFAQNQLTFATNQFGNSLASIVGSGEEGKGLFSIITTGIISAVSGISTATQSLVQAANIEKLEDLGRERLKIQVENNSRLKDNAELMEKIAESTEKVSVIEKQRAAAQAVTNIKINRDNLLKILDEELKVMEAQQKLDVKNEKLQDAIALKKLERSEIDRDAERAISRIDKIESNILDTEEKKTKELEKQARLRAGRELTALEKGKAKVDASIDERLKKGLAASNEMLTKDWVEHNDTMRKLDNESGKRYYKEKEKLSKDASDKEAKRQEKMADYTVQLYANQVSVYQQMLQQANDVGTALLKGFLINMLRMIKSALEARIIGESFATLDSIASFGISGAIRAAAIVGLVEGAFGLAESFIMGFDRGGVVSGTRIRAGHGTPIRRSNGDDVLITAKQNEVILNERQQRALGGDKVFRALGVPGFATGGSIGSAVSREYANNAMLREFYQKMSVQQTVLVIEQVEQKMQRRAQIRESATL